MTPVAATVTKVVGATFERELLSYRVNRFLYLHVALMLAIGMLALLGPADAASPATAWWVLNGVIYVASLSALLFGLSSAQAEADEFGLLFTLPVQLWAWVAGKCLGLLAVLAPSALLLVAPTVVSSGATTLLLGAAAAAAAVSVLLAWLGLAIGLWLHDPVRGMIVALAVWCGLLFGVDLLLITIGGADWIHRQPAAWVAVLMVSPLDAYRVTLLLVLERAAFSGDDLHPLTKWWVHRPAAWLMICLGGWSLLAAAAALAGARRRLTL